MKATITSIELKSIFKFFPLSRYAMSIAKQLKGTDVVDFKKKGAGRLHYTMTLWKSEADLKTFARSGAHLEGMKKSKKIAREIRTLTVETDALPDWKTAKAMLLKDGKVIRY